MAELQELFWTLHGNEPWPPQRMKGCKGKGKFGKGMPGGGGYGGGGFDGAFFKGKGKQIKGKLKGRGKGKGKVFMPPPFCAGGLFAPPPGDPGATGAGEGAAPSPPGSALPWSEASSGAAPGAAAAAGSNVPALAAAPPPSAGAHLASELQEKQKITLRSKVCEVKNAPVSSKLCVEIRVGSELSAQAIMPASRPVATTQKEGNVDARFEELLSLDGAVFDARSFVHVVLWSGDAENGKPCGRASLNMAEALRGSAYDPKATSPAVGLGETHTFTIEGQDCKDCAVTVQFGFWLHAKVTCHVQKAHKLPYMDLIGTIDGLVELRLLKGDWSRDRFPHSAGEESIWSGQTEVISNNQNPVWNQKLSFTTTGDPELAALVILWDDDTPMPATPVGVVTLPMGELIGGPPETPKDQKLRFLQVVGEDKVDGLAHARLCLQLSWKPAIKK